VVVECSGLTESLFESELFGHERGAFTGAYARKVGLVESADRGTLFLDEIGDVPLSLQVKLLRLLETGTYRRVGSVEPRQSNFRLITATHRDLNAMVGEGRFRRDLYYRISTFPIPLPALRERADDIPLLADSLLRRLSPARRVTLADETLALLRAYRFPGNIRELLNLLERALLLADGDEILPRHLPPVICDEWLLPVAAAMASNDAILPLDEVERRYLQAAVSGFAGDRDELAEKLGISRRTLYRKLEKIDR
jgi:DNA-binding NtrC family response regulator